MEQQLPDHEALSLRDKITNQAYMKVSEQERFFVSLKYVLEKVLQKIGLMSSSFFRWFLIPYVLKI
jgi:hypothetical protein